MFENAILDSIELTVDVSEAAGLSEDATVAMTVHLPAPELLGTHPTVCFAKPGGGFTKDRRPARPGHR